MVPSTTDGKAEDPVTPEISEEFPVRLEAVGATQPAIATATNKQDISSRGLCFMDAFCLGLPTSLGNS